MKILSICGSPRKGNSETILIELQNLFKDKGIDNEIVLLRDKKIEPCQGCVEFCNHKKTCRLHDDANEIINKMISADAFIFVSPNYFQMPTGIFKNFMDRSNILFSCDMDPRLKTKKTAVVCVGADKPEETEICTQNIAKLYCGRYIGNVVFTKSFQTHSELNGNYNDIFENGLNPTIKEDLATLVASML